MPADVMKTCLMNAPPGKYNSVLDCFKDTISEGPRGLFKGFIPAFIRLGKFIFMFIIYIFLISIYLGPQTILMFICLEQLKKHFGYIKSDEH